MTGLRLARGLTVMLWKTGVGDDFAGLVVEDFMNGFRFAELFLPEPLFFPPPSSLLTVAQARDSAVFVLSPFLSYPASMRAA